MAAGAGVAAWVRLYGSGPDFWNKKPPEEWSSEEIDRLITRSPWAKEVTGQYSSPEGANTGGGRPRGGLGVPGIGIGMGGPRIGMGGPRMGGGRGERAPGGGAQQYKGTVRWESAAPVLAALKTPLPEAFANHYVISVSGFPLSGGRRSSQDGNSSQATQDVIEQLKAYSSLQPKSKELAQPGVVQQQPSSGAGSFLFGFSRDVLDLSRDDKEVTFSTRLGRVVVKTKFNLLEMMYQGRLAL